MTIDANWFSGAELSDDRLFRYRLWRRWSNGFPTAYWIMLNPSTADERKDDATIRRCINFSRRWGFGGMEVVNLFAFRSTFPLSLMTAPDAIGPRNNEVLDGIAPDHNDAIIAAWGTFPQKLGNRDKSVCELLSGRKVKCLGLTLGGYPKHPVRLSNDTLLEDFPLIELAGAGGGNRQEPQK